MSNSRRALKGRGSPRRPTTSVLVDPTKTVTTKLPFPGFSGFTDVLMFAFSSSSVSFLDDRPKTPQDLHASIVTVAPVLEGVGAADLATDPPFLGFAGILEIYT